MVIRHTTYKINEIYSKGCRESQSKVTKITKFTKTAKFTIIHQTTYKISEIYSKGYRESPSKVTKSAKTTKCPKTAKFAIIRHTTNEVNEIYSKSQIATELEFSNVDFCGQGKTGEPRENFFRVTVKRKALMTLDLGFDSGHIGARQAFSPQRHHNLSHDLSQNTRW